MDRNLILSTTAPKSILLNTSLQAGVHLEISQHSFEKWLIGHTCEIRHAGLSIPQLRQDNLNYAAQLEKQCRTIIQTFLDKLNN